jgi:hypothetical protein
MGDYYDDYECREMAREMAQRILAGEDFHIGTYYGITAQQFRGTVESLCRPERRRKVEGEGGRLLLFY